MSDITTTSSFTTTSTTTATGVDNSISSVPTVVVTSVIQNGFSQNDIPERSNNTKTPPIGIYTRRYDEAQSGDGGY